MWAVLIASVGVAAVANFVCDFIALRMLLFYQLLKQLLWYLYVYIKQGCRRLAVGTFVGCCVLRCVLFCCINGVFRSGRGR